MAASPLALTVVQGFEHAICRRNQFVIRRKPYVDKGGTPEEFQEDFLPFGRNESVERFDDSLCSIAHGSILPRSFHAVNAGEPNRTRTRAFALLAIVPGDGWQALCRARNGAHAQLPCIHKRDVVTPATPVVNLDDGWT